MFKNYVKARAVEAQLEIEDLLLDKKCWLALLGLAVALAKAYNWDIPLEVFAAIEVLIIALITALSKEKQS